MTLTQLKDQIQHLSPIEQRELSQFLAALEDDKKKSPRIVTPNLGAQAGHSFEFVGDMDEPEAYWEAWLNDTLDASSNS